MSLKRTPKIQTLSLRQACDYYDWSTRQIEGRRNRHWKLGVHYYKPAGEFRYDWKAIDEWLEAKNRPPPVRHPDEKTDYIYLIRGGDLVKIGYSINPVVRMKNLQAGSPIPLELLGYIVGTVHEERALHRRFAEHHSHRGMVQRLPRDPRGV